MRAVAAELERVTETFGSLPPPSVEGRRLRKAIEGIVDFDRVELPGVVRKPLCLGKLLGIENSFPVFIMIAGRSDSKCAITAHKDSLMLNCSRLSEPLSPLLEPTFELWLGHCVQDVALFQPAAARLIDAVPHEAQLLGTVGVGIDGYLHADLSGAKDMQII